MNSDKNNRSLILNIYDTIADHSRWTNVLDEFAQHINAQGCIIFEWLHDGDERQLHAPFHSSFYTLDGINKYFEKCGRYETIDQDIFEAHSLQADGIDLIDDSVLANSLEELKQRKNVQVLQQFGILHRAACLLNKDNRLHSRFSVQFNANRGLFSQVERNDASLILPHIAKALDLGRPAKQLARKHGSLIAAMDRLTIGVCVLDEKGRIAIANEEFKRQQAVHSAFFIKPDGQLQLSNDQDQKRFHQLKIDAMNHGKFGARPRKEAVTANTDTYLCIEVTPLTRSEEIGSKDFDGFILYSTDTSLPVLCNTVPIQLAYGLTDAEISLVDMIAEGLTNREIADQRGRSVSTINAQVKAILSKTNCSTRTQFVRLMMSFGVNYLNND